jgi:hypothetical protein
MMGQATLDLHDPLSGVAHESAASADDLLSQMAGDEIDRLLADADVDSSADVVQSTEPSTPIVQTTLDETMDQPPQADPPTAEADDDELFQSDALAFSSPDLNAPEIQAQLSSELDQLFDTLNNPEPPPPADPPVVDQATEPTQANASPAEVEAAGSLTTAPSIQEEQAATAALLESIEPTHAAAPLPVWLRPLEWLNSPLSGLTDSARSALGKAALITLFNALVILAYVLLFRKH